jgi:hypothetical protein
VFNVALDLITTYMVAYRINVGLRMKTYDGTLLENLQQFSDRFESYAMQRTLANNLYAYAFPATFLIPFLIEPVATIYAPYKMMMAIVRTQPSMKGFMAERLLGSLVFDLSRYADLMLDVMIAVLIFFFPGMTAANPQQKDAKSAPQSTAVGATKSLHLPKQPHLEV